MPLPYRAPEVILQMDWGTPVDMWAVGLLISTRQLYSSCYPPSNTG